MFKFFKPVLLSAVLLLAQPAIASDLMPLEQGTYLHTYTHILGLEPIPESYKTAGLVFLPELEDSEFGWNGKEFSSNHNKGDNCSGYELTSCPVHGSCSSCPFDRRYKRLVSCTGGYTKNGNSCKASSCSAVGYESSIPANKICTKYTEGSLTCYKDCKSVSCSGYTLNCDSFNVANSAGKATCPDCESGNANCSPKLCKVSSCLDGFKIADNGTTCVALDDNCPDGYFKECETGTQGDPQYTEKGTACWQCKPKSVPSGVGDILYSDMTTSSELISGKTPIGVVFDEEKKLAVALDERIDYWSTAYFDIPDLTNYKTSATAVSDWNGKINTKIIIDYCRANSKNCPAAEFANAYSTDGTSSGDWYLPASGELNEIYINIENLNKTLSKINKNIVFRSIHWSSTEYGDMDAWFQDFANNKIDPNNFNGRIVPSDKYSSAPHVRPVINYGEVNNALPILYSDLTTSTEIVPGKTPIGVVFDESKKLAIALNYESKVWSTEYFDIPGLTNQSSSEALAAWNGKANTKTIVDYCKSNSKSCPAAEYANSFTTVGTSAGDWYLPSLGELNAIYTNKTTLNSMLSRLGGTNLPESWHWSSSEFLYNNAWDQTLSDGYMPNDSKSNSGYVRPVINYGEVLTGMDLMCAQLSNNPEARFCGGIDPYAGNRGNYPYCLNNGSFTNYAGALNNGHTCWSCAPGEKIHCYTNSPSVSGCNTYENGKCVLCYNGTLVDGMCK